MSHTRLRSAWRKDQRARQSFNPLLSWLSVSVLGLMALGTVASLWSTYHGDQLREDDMRKWKSWPSTIGSPSATRIVDRTPRPILNFVYRSFVRQCRVEYVVAGKERSIWADVAENRDRREIEEPFHTCPVESFVVHYDPADPSQAHAFPALKQ